MNYSKNGLHLTENFEGLRLTAYPDPATHGDPWTIGYGHTGAEVHQGMTITQEQAEEFLMQDVQKAVQTVNSKVHTDLTQNEFDALVSFVYNLGVGAFQRSTLLKLLKSGNKTAASGEFPKWSMAGGKEVPGILKRRHAEQDCFLHSTYVG